MIEIKNLYKDWEEFSIRDINLKIAKGEYFVLLGPTGAGKTLLLELIAGFHIPDRGGIYTSNREVTQLPPEKKNIGFIYQDYSLFPHLSVKENVKFGLKIRRFKSKEMEKRTSDIMELLQISHLAHRRPNTLSGGEQQKVAIARALVTMPEVLLLDEPLNALDPNHKDSIMDELKRLNKTLNLTMLHVTHDRMEAIALADRIAIMMDGTLRQVGDPYQIFSEPIDEEVAAFVGIENIFCGRSKIENGVAIIDLGEISIEALTDRGGAVKVCIRPEEIIISDKKFGSSARNHLEGKVTKVSERYPMMKLTVDVGREFVVLITKRSFSEMELTEGSRVYIAFKASSVHCCA